MVAHWSTSPQYLVAQTCFLVVPGVRTLDLSGPDYSIIITLCYLLFFPLAMALA